LRILVTNDDGIDAPGLEALRQAACEFGGTIVLAPDQHLSGCSHRATTDRHLELTTLGEGRYKLDGTPTDCTRVGLMHLAEPIDWVLAGINDGGNLGADVYLSGTVAAVREATLLGKPGIAFSQYRRRGIQVDWPRASKWVRQTLSLLLAKQLPLGSFFNVNLPCLDADAPTPEICFCPLDPHPLPVEYRQQEGKLHYQGNYHLRARRTGSDVDCCFAGRIAVTQISLPA
jgi:5'-nucleotidase